MTEPVEVWTDGACSGNPGPGGWGAILSYKGKERELSGGEALTTNNRMELMAAISALEALKKSCVVDLTTDSQYVRRASQAGSMAGRRTAGAPRTRSGEERRVVAAPRCRAQAARGALALDQGPRRPRRKRARRSIGARGRGDGDVEELNCHRPRRRAIQYSRDVREMR